MPCLVDEAAVLHLDHLVDASTQSVARTVAIGDQRREAGLELLRRIKPPCLILLDLVMPVLDGVQATNRIRAELPGVRTIVMTASEKGEPLLDAVAAGASGYLTKRASGEELRQAVLTVHGGGSVIARSSSTSFAASAVRRSRRDGASASNLPGMPRTQA